MQIISSAFRDQADIPVKYTCDGDNISPPLDFVDVPESAESLVLIMDDPDVPSEIKEDGVWDHWILFDIPTDITNLKEGESVGQSGAGTSGSFSYDGPCPPRGQHRYFFKLYALDKKLDLPAGSKKSDIEEKMAGHIVDKADLVGTYSRELVR